MGRGPFPCVGRWRCSCLGRRREDGVSGGLDVVDLFDVMGEEVREAELGLRIGG